MTLQRNYSCKICKKSYAMEWARDNHFKICNAKEATKPKENNKAK